MYIQTKRLLIRPYEDRDLEAMVELLKNETVTKTFMVPDYPSEEDYQRLFRRMQEDSRAEDRYAGGVYLDDQLVGLLLDVEVTERSVELGYALHPDYHNRCLPGECRQHPCYGEKRHDKIFAAGGDRVPRRGPHLRVLFRKIRRLTGK